MAKLKNTLNFGKEMSNTNKESVTITITKGSGCSISKDDSSGKWAGSWFFSEEHLTKNEKVFVDNILSMSESMIKGEKNKDE